VKVRYTPEAIDDLRRLVDFVEAENPYAARRIANDLQEGIAKLKRFPRIGLPVSRAPRPDLIRDLYIGRYLARYLIDEDCLYILRIWHNREAGQDLPDLSSN
jgi:plasmid stabilization system protein ParE